MKKLTYLFVVLLAVTACSVESLDSAEGDLVTAEMKTKAQNAEESFKAPDLVCVGEEAEFCLTFPQATKGNGDPKTTNIQVQLYDVDTDEWIQIFHEDHHTEACFNYTFDEVRAYDLRYQIGGGGFTETSVSVEDCKDCEESFIYVDNEDGSYTFTYVPAEDIDEAELVFTFAQGTAVSGLEEWTHNGNGNAQTWKKSMDLEACESYTWIVSLTAECPGKSDENNVWTDFKVNEISKKGDLTNIVQNCN